MGSLIDAHSPMAQLLPMPPILSERKLALILFILVFSKQRIVRSGLLSEDTICPTYRLGTFSTEIEAANAYAHDQEHREGIAARLAPVPKDASKSIKKSLRKANSLGLPQSFQVLLLDRKERGYKPQSENSLGVFSIFEKTIVPLSSKSCHRYRGSKRYQIVACI